jgi:hypothetical protein
MDIQMQEVHSTLKYKKSETHSKTHLTKMYKTKHKSFDVFMYLFLDLLRCN